MAELFSAPLPPSTCCIALGYLFFAAALAVLPDASGERSRGNEGVVTAGAHRHLIGARNRACDLSDQNPEQEAGTRLDLELIVHHLDDSMYTG